MEAANESANESVGSPATAALPPPPPKRSPWRAIIVWLLVLAALGAGGWYGWQWVNAELQALAARDAQVARLISESQQLREQIEGLAHDEQQSDAVAKKTAADLAALTSRVDEASSTVSRMAETIQGGRLRVQLSAVEQVLLMANDRALLERDAIGAEQALGQADARLAALNEPKVFPVREAIAKERAALNGVPKVDLTAATLSLSSLIEGLPKLPLQGQLPGKLLEAKELSSSPQYESWPARLWVSLKQALSAVFIIRRDEGASRLLPPEQQTLILHVGLLKLEGSRLALMRGNTAAFRELLTASSNWLRDYFEPEDPGVKAAQAELAKLRALDLAPSLPDITGSLDLLRKQMAAQ